MNQEDSEIKRQHDQEQLEAQYAELGVTVLPPSVTVGHPAFAAIVAAVMLSETPLTQQQIQDIIERTNEEGNS